MAAPGTRGPHWLGFNSWIVNVHWGSETVYFITAYSQFTKKLDTHFDGWSWNIDLNIDNKIAGMVPKDTILAIPAGGPMPSLPLVLKEHWEEHGVITWPQIKKWTQVKEWFEPAFGGAGYWIGYDIVVAWQLFMISPYGINKALGVTKETGGLSDPIPIQIHMQIPWTDEMDHGAALAEEYQKLTVIGVKRSSLLVGINPENYRVEAVSPDTGQTYGQEFWSTYADDTKILSLPYTP